MNQPLTEAQELEALQKIKQIVAELGPYSYLAFTFAGVWELAEENIRNDLYRNPVDHANELEARLAEERDEYKARAEAAEAQLNGLKAKLYDYMTSQEEGRE